MRDRWIVTWTRPASVRDWWSNCSTTLDDGPTYCNYTVRNTHGRATDACLCAVFNDYRRWGARPVTLLVSPKLFYEVWLDAVCSRTVERGHGNDSPPDNLVLTTSLGPVPLQVIADSTFDIPRVAHEHKHEISDARYWGGVARQ